MYKNMLSKLEDIKDKFVDEKTIDTIFEAEDWECMGYNKAHDELIYIESPMGPYIELKIELSEEPIEWGILAPDTKIKIKCINKMYWED